MKKRTLQIIAVLLLIHSLVISPLQAKVLYVNGVNGNNSVTYANNNGWSSAWKDLVHALYWAQANDEIWLNTGTYVPVQAGFSYIDPRAQSFWTHSNIKIYGGFSIASGATTFAQRNPAAYPAFLSGEIQNDGIASNNSYTVIKTYFNNGFSVLDGVTVTGSNNTTFWGGGLNINNCSPTINNCIFSGNHSMRGAGMLIDRTGASPCSPTITNCLFTGNSAEWGGAIYNAGCQPTINACNFSSNSAQIGAGIYNDEKLSTPGSSVMTNNLFQGNAGMGAIYEYKNTSQIIGCTFTNNIGGGIHSLYALGTITDCIFTGNTATPTPIVFPFIFLSEYYNGHSYGGGLCFNFCAYKVNSCTFNSNSATYGGAVSVNEVVENGNSYFYFLPTLFTTISNCLITNNNSTYAIFSKRTSLHVNNCTIVNNVDGGVYLNSNDAGKVPSFNNNCIYNNNSLGSLGNDDFVAYGSVEDWTLPLGVREVPEGAPIVKNCLVGTITWSGPDNVSYPVDGGGNIVGVNPLLEPDFTLNSCSPAINAGNNSLLPPPFNVTDRAGNPRFYQGGIVDIGCFEKQSAIGGSLTTNSTQYICNGDSILIHGVYEKNAGTYSASTPLPNGCISIDNVTLVVRQKPIVSVRSLNNCGTSGTIQITPLTGLAPFQCVLAGDTISNIGLEASVVFSNKTNGTYTYSVSDTSGCAPLIGNFIHSNYGNIVPNILYVDANATGYQNGLNWPNAFTSLQDALNHVSCGATEIWVSEGTYTPTQHPNGSYTTTPFATFQMQNNLKILGGFSTAHGVTTLSSRNYTLYPTILSGEIQHDGINTNNAYNVINNYNTGLNNTAILDGFTIRDAYNNITGLGGGMINNGSSPKIENCIFTKNYCIKNGEAKGGAMYNGSGSSPLVMNCKFLNNEVSGFGNMFGGAVANYSSAPVFQKCIFDGNTATSTFNQAGGAMYSYQGSPVTLDNCLIINNNASAICSDGNSMNINNCTITKNTASPGLPGGYYCIGNGSFVTNTIIYGNSSPAINNISVSGSAPNYFYCDIEGSGGSANWNTALGINYGANKDENPRLSSTYQLGTCSPAINAGTPGYSSLTSDLSNNPRNYLGIDMGCFERQTVPPSYSSVVFVDVNATGANTGLNWTDAFTDLQSALDLTCYPVTEIWVSKGTYVPSKDPSGNIVSTPQACFRMRNGVTIYGGFSVSDGAIIFPLRNVEAYPTILSGDIQRDGIHSNNVYNVINNYENGLNLTAVLDGVTVSDAYNTYPTGGAGITWGAGVINRNSSPLFRNCSFKNNINAALSSAFGAGVYNRDCNAEFYNCKFIHNTTNGSFVSYGAGMANINSNIVVKQCVFDDNNGIGPNSVGGGLYNSGGSLSMENCLLTRNIGGAICVDGTSFNLKNSTITQNTGMNQNAGGVYALACSPIITNSIIYNNPGGSITNVSAFPTFAYCDVDGSGAPTNWNTNYGINYGANKDVDPLLTSDYKLTACSPALEAGTSAFGLATTDLANNPRTIGIIVDMGCYEFNGSFSSAYGNVVYVDVNATGTKTGLSWTNAFTNLQDALDITKCTNVQEIWVSKGTYYPGKAADGRRVNDASACFVMKNNVKIIGGFSVADGATTLATRNYQLYSTKLSGDIQQDGIDGNNTWNVINNHQTGVNSTAVLDGFMVTKAYNNLTGLGGGVINANTSPTFLNCFFHDNYAGGMTTARGAGMHNQQGANPYIENCIFSYNYSSGVTNAFGSGMSNDNSTPLIGRCKFIGNICAAPNAAGGGIYCNGGSPITVDNCLFTNNNAAAILSDGNNVVLNNVTITENTPTLTSVAGGLCFIDCNPSIYNSIIYNNIGGSVKVYSGIPTFAYSDIQGSGAPLSWNTAYGVNYGANKDVAPNWNAAFKPYPCSPTVNAATTAFGFSPKDLDGNPRLFGINPDMGCYEASESNHGIINASICANTYYIFPLIPGAYYNLPGTYNITVPGASQGGCDSLITLNLTVKPTSTSSTTTSACGSYTWNGIVYTTSGIKTFTTTNAAGCDSVATLNLTINQTSLSSQQVNACTNYVWNGIVYTTSGVKTFTTTNAAGCDSVATLNLTINQVSSSTQQVYACANYVWNGTVYTSSGIKTFTTTNAAGCDSIAYLNLTISSTPQNQFASALQSSICPGGVANIQLLNSENDVEYTLLKTIDASVLSSTQHGTGGSILLTSQPLGTNTTISILARRNIDHALHFNGVNSYLQANAPVNSNNGTWEAWVSKDNWNDQHDDRLFGNGINFGASNSFYISLHPSVGFHFRYGGTGDAGNAFASSNITQSFVANSWHHLAATWSSNAGTTTLKLFVDGIEVSSANSTANLLFGSTSFIGGGGDPANQFFGAGKMDEIRVWNVAKTASEIQSTMNTCNSISQGGLLANWKLNDVIGSTSAHDVSGGNHDATLNNFNAATDWVNGALNCPSCDFIFPQTISIAVAPCTSTLQLKLFLQGYYSGLGFMTNTLANQGVGSSSANVDSITVELHNATSPYNMVATTNAMLQTNGTAMASFSTNYSGDYYVVIKHRNSIQTWSANPITISSITNYDFSTAANKAYGDNMIEVEPNVFAFYSGDINQDENIDLLDAASLETDINEFQYGYFETDINGDGNVDLLDAPIVETNINQFVFSSHP